MSRPHLRARFRRAALALGTALAVTVSGLAFAATPAQAADRLPDVDQPTGSGSCIVVLDSDRAQTFRARTTGELDRVEVYGVTEQGVTSPDVEVFVQLRRVTGGTVGTQVLAEGPARTFMDVSTQRLWNSVTFPTPVQVQQGSDYAIVLINMSRRPPYFYWCLNNSNPYPEGHVIHGEQHGPIEQGTAFPDLDFVFRTYVGQAQRITFRNAGPQNFGTTPTLIATSDSQLTPTLTSSTPAVCAIESGGALRFLKAGACTIHAEQGGNATYASAPRVNTTFAVNRIAQSMTFTQPANTTYGGAEVPLSATTTATDGSVTFESTTTSICRVDSGRVVPLAAGTCTITAAHDGGVGHLPVSESRNLTVAKASQTIAFPQPADTVYNGDDVPLTATAPAGRVTFTSTTPEVCTIEADKARPVATGTCTITASQDGDHNHESAPPVTRSLTVAKAVQTIAFPQPADPVYNGADVPLNATAPGGPVTFTSTTPEVCTVVEGAAHPVTAGTCTITATQDGDRNHHTAPPATRDLTVAKADQALTFTQPRNTTFEGATVPLTATAPGGSVTFTSTTPKTCSVVGGRTRPLSPGTCTITATQRGDSNHQAAAPVSRSLQVGKANVTVTSTAKRTATGKVRYVTTVRSATTGRPIAGMRITAQAGRTAKCTKLTNLRGRTTCTARARKTLKKRITFTVTAQPTASYNGTRITRTGGKRR